MSQIITDLHHVLSNYLPMTQPAAPAVSAHAPTPASPGTQHAMLRQVIAADHQYMSITLDECAQEFEDLVNFH